jgi:hypothetical protein
VNDRVSLADWHVMLQVEVGHPDGVIRPLFFPTRQDFRSGRLNKKYLSIDEKFTAQWKLPLLDPLYTIDRVTYGYRRPGFLARLSGDEYIEVFDNLRFYKDLSCSTW